MGFIKGILKLIKLKMCTRTNEGRVNYLRSKGAKIGNNVVLNCSVSSFGTEPYLIEVGDNCLFASNIRLITHDGGVTVLNHMNYFNGEKRDMLLPVKIGNNVYIGVDAKIMPGITVGDNVIIGAGAIVTKDIPSNSLAVGIPARVIKTIDEYYEGLMKKGLTFPTVGMSWEEKKKFYEDVFKNR